MYDTITACSSKDETTVYYDFKREDSCKKIVFLPYMLRNVISELTITCQILQFNVVRGIVFRMFRYILTFKARHVKMDSIDSLACIFLLDLLKYMFVYILIVFF